MGKYLIDCTKDVVYFKYSHPFEILRDLKEDTETLKWNIAICGDGTKSKCNCQKYTEIFSCFSASTDQMEELLWIKLYIN